MSVADSSSPLEILVREPGGFAIWNGPPFSNNQPSIKLDKVPCTSAKFSEDGSKLMVIKSESAISIYDCKTLNEIRCFESPNVLAAALSPCGTYLQTFQKASSPQEKNVTLWKTETGESVYALSQKNMTKATWPSIRFSSDEAVASRMATNELQFFDSGDFSKGVVHKIRVPGVASAELSNNPGSHVAAFVPESKGMPGSVQIYACAPDSQSEPIARRSFFRCSSVQQHWNNGSTGLLVVAQADVDKTNQSYYGETKLYYLTLDGSHDGLVKKGLYMMFSGRTQEKNLLLFMDLCRQWQLFLTRSASLSYSLGKALTIPFVGIQREDAMATYQAFWDYVEKKQLGTTKAEWSVTSEWSPDGRYFMTATTAPRLQVDNGIKIFHYNGKSLFKKKFDKLYQVDWKAESPDKFGDIEELIKSMDSLKVESKSQGQGSKSSQAKPINPPVQKKPAAYQPPHAKAKAAKEAELFGGSPSVEMSKNALKNKKKREKQREKKAAEAGSAANGAD
ncbi:hypothetical protein M8C21_011330 [Ambrosia artemisiifolia]|uniref:Eukaryotic translation initiation factor 2A n=1 Tax=Ambrosia artemisiifolia TaxID=4212 RepID=A0AAD5CSR3_AMBAR|nr:hypothetical protein M8C21_011330 [Ambrosia artemisiifolia]